ncbi:MAG: EF-P beta-lysylation protein EpmB, partial [Pirellulaceae bacterium]
MVIVAAPPSSVGATLPTWQMAMQSAIRSGVALCRQLGLPASYEQQAREVEAGFPVFAPLEYVSRMTPGDPGCPLLRQVLPLGEELIVREDFTHDPVGDIVAERTPGLLQKYAGRVLLITTSQCAVHCRYCFRREYPYAQDPSYPDRWRRPLEAIEADPTIEEVILSGGDPLTLSDARLAELAKRLEAIPHVRRLRIHSRLPIVIPQRINAELLDWLTGSRLTPVFVVHANHPREIDDPVAGAFARLIAGGVPLLNQAVLLRGVNDDPLVLFDLCRKLVDLRVMPYYLHQLDRVHGAAHFEVSVERGRELMAELRARLPGYAV